MKKEESKQFSELPFLFRPPVFEELGTLPRGTHIIERSYSSGRANFFRKIQGEVLQLSLKLTSYSAHTQVRLYSNFGEEWSDLSFFWDQKDKFVIEIPLTKCRPYQFKAKYTVDGKNWFWDCADYSYLLVDPSILENLRMYTLLPTVSGSIKDWQESLELISQMGFNVVHLLPITEFGASQSPYAAYDLFNIDRSYRNSESETDLWEQFLFFIEKAKQLKLGLCFDLVLNHIGLNSKMVKFSVDWLRVDRFEKDNLKRAGYADGDRWKKWEDLVLIDYDHPDPETKKNIWNYMTEYALFWAKIAFETGGLIRLDNLHSSHPQFIKHVIASINREFPGLAIFAELFSDERVTANYILDCGVQLLLATPWISPFAPETRTLIKNMHLNFSRKKFLLPVSSQDSGTPSEEYGKSNATVSRYALYALGGTGATGMSQGTEFGLPKRLNFVGFKKRATLNRTTYGYDFSNSIRIINQIMDTYQVFSEGGNIHFIDNNHPAIIAFLRGDLSRGTYLPEQKSQAPFLIIINLDVENSQKYLFDQSSAHLNLGGRTLINELVEEKIEIGSSPIELFIVPCGLKIFRIF